MRQIKISLPTFSDFVVLIARLLLFLMGFDRFLHANHYAQKNIGVLVNHSETLFKAGESSMRELDDPNEIPF